MASTELLVRIKADLSDFNSKMKGFNSRLKKVGDDMTRVGRTASMALSAPIAGVGVAMLKTAGDFEQGMNKVKALTQASEEDFISLQKQAQELGRTTRYSATQASEGMSFLAMAGFETNEILSAMPNVLTLASSANLDLGRSADIVSNVMQGFGQDSEQLSASVDVLTKAFVSSNTDLSQLGEAMKFVGPVANSFGIAFEEATASVGLLSDAGLQAGMAGTGLRRVLTGLSQNADKLGISVFDASGNMRPLADIIQQLEERGITASESMELFGQRGGPALQILLERGSDALRSFTGELSNSGGIAQSIADTQMQGFNGAMIELRSAVEGMLIAFAETGILTKFEEIVDNITERIRSLTNASDQTKTNIIAFASALALAGPAVFAFGLALKSASVGMAILTSPITGIIVGIAGLVVAFDYVRRNLEALKADFIFQFNFIKLKVLSIIRDMIDGMTGVFERFGIDILGGAMDGIDDMIEGTAEKIADTADSPELQSFSDYWKSVGGDVQGLVNQMFALEDASKKASKSVEDAIGKRDIEGQGFNEVPEEAPRFRMAEEVDAQIIPESTLLQMELLEDLTNKANQAFKMLGGAISEAFARSIVMGERLGDVLKGLLKQLASQVLQKFLMAVLTGGAGGVFGKVAGGFFGKGGGVFGKITGALFGGAKMAQGGIVPRGFPNDTYPALLTSGEMVVPKPHALPSMGGAVEVFGELRVRGSDLVTAISNTNNRTLR